MGNINTEDSLLPVPPLPDYTLLLPDHIAGNQHWLSLFQIVTQVFNEHVDRPITQLQQIRDPAVMDRILKISTARMLGFDYNSSNLTDDDYERLVQFLSEYNTRQGTEDFLDFLGFVKNTRFQLHPLWAKLVEDSKYTDFIERAAVGGFDIFNNPGDPGAYFPTTHVGVSYDELNFPLPSENDLRELFYVLAPVNLVLQWIAGSFTFDTKALYLGGGMLDDENFICRVQWPMDGTLNLAGGILETDHYRIQGELLAHVVKEHSPTTSFGTFVRNSYGWYKSIDGIWVQASYDEPRVNWN